MPKKHVIPSSSRAPIDWEKIPGLRSRPEPPSLPDPVPDAEDRILKRRVFQCTMDPAMREAIDRLASRRSVPMSTIIQEAMIEYMENQGIKVEITTKAMFSRFRTPEDYEKSAEEEAIKNAKQKEARRIRNIARALRRDEDARLYEAMLKDDLKPGQKRPIRP